TTRRYRARQARVEHGCCEAPFFRRAQSPALRDRGRSKSCRPQARSFVLQLMLPLAVKCNKILRWRIQQSYTTFGVEAALMIRKIKRFLSVTIGLHCFGTTCTGGEVGGALVCLWVRVRLPNRRTA